MKKLYFLLFSICTLLTYSQAPKLINYQGIARHGSGSPVTSPIKIKFDIFSSGVGGTPVFTETQSTNTNSLGLFSTQIGKTAPLNINWGSGNWFLEVSIDTTNSGSSFVIAGRQQMVSVPFALYAENAGSAPSPSVTFSNNILYVGTNSVSLPASQVYVAGNGIAINSGSVINTAPDQLVTITPSGNAQVAGPYPNFTVNVTPQTLSINANTISLTNGGGNIVLPATSTTPNTSLTASGIATVTSSGTNTFNVAVLAPTIIGTGGTSVSGVYPNFVINSTPGAPGVTPTITGTGVANVTPLTGNNFTVNVPAPNLSYGGNVLTIVQGTSSSAVTLPAGVTPTITGQGIATVTPLSGNNFTVNVAPLNLTGLGSATVSGIYPNININTPLPPPPAWSLQGNVGTNTLTNFIGTTDNVPFNFRVNNQKAGRIDPLQSNTSFGYWASRDNTSGTQNSAFGINSLFQNTTGSGNSAFGTMALQANLTGSDNTALGSGAGFSSVGNANVFIGYQAGYNETGSNKLYIANSSVNPPLIYGDFASRRLGLGTITPSTTLDVFGNTQIIDNSTPSGFSAFIQNNNAGGISGGALNVNNSGSRSIDNSAVQIQNLVTKSGGSGSTKTGLNIQSTGSWAPGTGQTNVGLSVNVSGADINRSAVFNGGGISIVDGTEGLGKVLTSDAVGNSSWQPLSITGMANFTAKTINNVNTTPVALTGILGTFTKSTPGSKVQVTIQTHIMVDDMSGTNAVTYEIRLNGASPSGNTGRVNYFRDNNNIGTKDNYQPVTIIAEFTSLPTGTYNVEIWANSVTTGSATGVWIEPGNYGASSVIFKEYR
ncbi:MAG: hypothetical protein JWO32_1782 [Bacteroidetes bacterium]|nr:hypothetical protein [Bacteroidota bacterium]